ncbi:MAG TPA: ABC transporter permease [Phycisphaerales bacterium]|nr:ABC transporter permease [Phycisphaerales bacterium]
MREIWALAMKDLRLLVRDKAGFFFTFFFPILYAIFFGTMFGGATDDAPSATPIIVVDLDKSEGSREFVESLSTGGDLAVTPMDDRNAALDQVRLGKKAAVVIVPEGFGDAAANIFAGEPMRLGVGVDPSRSAEAGLIQGLLTAHAYERLQTMFTDFSVAQDMAQNAIESIDQASDDDLPPAQRAILKTFLGSLDNFLTALPEAQAADGDASGAVAFNPVEIESIEVAPPQRTGPRSPYAVSFPQGIVWGIMGCAAGFGISLVTERNKGTLTRLRTAPLARSRVLLGKALACFLTTVGVATMLLVIARLAFGVVPSSLPLLVAAVLSAAVAFVGIMMLLATIGRTEAAAGGIGWAVLLVLAMFGGGMIPLMFMKGWMQTLSHFSPVKWAIYALEGAIWRGFTPEQMLLPCGILVGIGVVGFTLGSRLFDWTEG